MLFLISLRSKRFCTSSSREVGARAKIKGMTGDGGGERRKRLPANPTILKNCVRPRTQLPIGAVLVVLIYLALETSIKPGMLCLREPQIWSYLICCRRLQFLWTDIESCFSKVYEIRVFKVYWEIEQWRLGKANLLRMTTCGSDWKKWTVCGR